MKVKSEWGNRPYFPIYEKEKENAPYICRHAPFETGFEAEWFDNGFNGPHFLYWQHISETEWHKVDVKTDTVAVHGLKTESEYRFYIAAENGKRSHVRLVRTGSAPGVVVNYIHPRETQYIYSGVNTCSPSLIKLPNGRLLASHDVYKKNGAQNLTIIYGSDDGGNHWKFLTELFPCCWGSLFLNDDKVYCLGVSTEYGDLLLGCSSDGGKTWSTPVVLGRGCCKSDGNGFQKAAIPIIHYSGRIWALVEFGSWSTGEFCYPVYSADENDDLMNPDSWIISEPLKMDYVGWGLKKISDKLGLGYNSLPIEGNLIVMPDGELKALLRCMDNTAVLLKMDYKNPEKALEFEKTLKFPMAHSKFEIRQKEEFGYIAVGNRLPKRNILSIYTSDDALNWNFEKNILDFSSEDFDGVYIGVQYPSFFFENNAVNVLVRAAINNADNFHDANYILFCTAELHMKSLKKI